MGKPVSDAIPAPPSITSNIWIACADGDLDAVRYFVEEGQISVNAQDDTGYSALHAAVSYDCVQIAQYLISKGALPSICDEDGDCPMHAVESTEMLQLLLEAGADPSLKNLEGLSVSTFIHFVIMWMM
jgi:ankyrin repeat protein